MLYMGLMLYNVKSHQDHCFSDAVYDRRLPVLVSIMPIVR